VARRAAGRAGGEAAGRAAGGERAAYARRERGGARGGRGTEKRRARFPPPLVARVAVARGERRGGGGGKSRARRGAQRAGNGLSRWDPEHDHDGPAARVNSADQPNCASAAISPR
jgi:hypothetical protein